jgi:hypothetical protein
MDSFDTGRGTSLTGEVGWQCTRANGGMESERDREPSSEDSNRCIREGGREVCGMEGGERWIKGVSVFMRVCGSMASIRESV